MNHMRLIICLSKINKYIHICMYNFYLNKLLKLFILLKETIMIIKIHIKYILNCIIYSINFIGERVLVMGN